MRSCGYLEEYFVDVAIVLASFGMYALLAALDFRPMLESPGPEPDETTDRQTT